MYIVWCKGQDVWGPNIRSRRKFYVREPFQRFQNYVLLARGCFKSCCEWRKGKNREGGIKGIRHQKVERNKKTQEVFLNGPASLELKNPSFNLWTLCDWSMSQASAQYTFFGCHHWRRTWNGYPKSEDGRLHWFLHCRSSWPKLDND